MKVSLQRAVGRCKTAGARAEIRFGAAVLKDSRRRRAGPIQPHSEADHPRTEVVPRDVPALFEGRDFLFYEYEQSTYKDVKLW